MSSDDPELQEAQQGSSMPSAKLSGSIKPVHLDNCAPSPPGGIFHVHAAMVAPEPGGREEPPALASLIAADVSSVTCLAHSCPPLPHICHRGRKNRQQSQLCSPLCLAEMAGKVPATQLQTTRTENKQNLIVSPISCLML